MKQSPNGPVPNAGEIKQILNFLRDTVNKYTLADVKLLLEPCCKPILTIAEDYACTSDSYTVFNSATVSFPQAGGKAVTLLFTFTLADGTVYTSTEHVTLSSTGTWTDNILLTAPISGGTADVTVSVIVDGSRVASISDSVSLTGIPNCD